MYRIFQNTAFYLCRFDFNSQGWEWVKKFENEQELVAYIASCFRNEIICWDEDDCPKAYRAVNSLTYCMNYTGNDTCTSTDGGRYFRDTMLVDENNRIIDYRDYLEKALVKFNESTSAKYHPRWRRYMPVYEYRKDPVPFTGHCHGCYGRTVKHWFRSYRDDRIPEYQPYVRKKAMVPNTYDSEPFEHVERCWKKQTKHRHQWEKNLHHKKENYNFRYVAKKARRGTDDILFPGIWEEDGWDAD